MNEAAHTISLISPSKSSSSFFNRATEIQYELEAHLASGMERDRSNLWRSIRHQEIFEPQPGNFG